MIFKKLKSYNNSFFLLKGCSKEHPFFISKNSFTLIEVLFVVLILGIVLQFTIPNLNKHTNLDTALKNIKLHLNFARYMAHIDNKQSYDDLEYLKKNWTLKFQRCKEEVGGLYYVVYSDMSGGTAAFKKEDTLKDPLNKKYLYSNNDCTASNDESKYVLLTKEYGVTHVNVSCNTTSAIGQISFAYDGNVYTSLGSDMNMLESQCNIKIFDQENNSKTIFIEPYTGYIH